ncbi:hypothetical protein [Halarcobacter anaerophilus]|uniref:Uncharacterized protein n=1 Tax=Halarcobacter anaerophilus TaxID=877500 RepID=A0A4Q0Y3Q9_9BACT|nr:hypothetical protein [Halarcobacter anaerophilus]QDF29929.1 hypothetical protein AANAER_2473 [Halarcobacter anaerophilus]RXJ62891.1 hypothetical protein CRV06_08635 [Halarcobacter anaerophilus]
MKFSKKAEEFSLKYKNQKKRVSNLEKYKDDIFYLRLEKIPILKILEFLKEEYQYETSYSNLYNWIQRNEKRLNQVESDYVLAKKNYSDKNIEMPNEISSNEVVVRKEKIDVKKDNKKEEPITIELIDGTIERYKPKYLKCAYIKDRGIGDSQKILEKNIYSFDNNYKDIEMNIEKLSLLVKEKAFIKNYSLIIHNNSDIDNKAHIYRLIDGELFKICEKSASYLIISLKDLRLRSRERFYNKYNEMGYN